MDACPTLLQECILQVALNHNSDPFGYLYMPRRLRILISRCIASLDHFEKHFKHIFDVRKSKIQLKPDGAIDVTKTVENFRSSVSKSDFLKIAFHTGADLDWTDIYKTMPGAEIISIHELALKELGFLFVCWRTVLRTPQDFSRLDFKSAVRKTVELHAVGTLRSLLKGVNKPEKEEATKFFTKVKSQMPMTKEIESVFDSFIASLE
uniref:Uncharacterized protein n=1 Tax=Steinernema glaseri TaxID=37863 RepID=A0A1I8AHW4_9BILA